MRCCQLIRRGVGRTGENSPRSTLRDSIYQEQSQADHLEGRDREDYPNLRIAFSSESVGKIVWSLRIRLFANPTKDTPAQELSLARLQSAVKFQGRFTACECT